MPAEDEMLAIAKEVGYSETAFLVKQADGWRVRYFAPAREVPFCGHATTALGAAKGIDHDQLAEDMGVPSRLTVAFTPKAGEKSIAVSGEARRIE